MSEPKIEITNNEYNSFITINNVNDIDLSLFTTDFFRMMDIDYVEPELLYNYELSKTNIVIKDNDVRKEESVNLNIPQNDLSFVKSAPTTMSLIWDSINSLLTQKVKTDSITLNDRANEHPNPDYKYKIVLDIDNIDSNNIMRLDQYLERLANDENKSIFNIQNNGLSYKHIVEIIEDIYLQLEYQLELDIFTSVIDIRDVYFIKGRFVILNTTNMEKKIYDTSLEKNISVVFLEFILKFTKIDKESLIKLFENTLLVKTIRLLEQGVFLL